MSNQELSTGGQPSSRCGGRAIGTALCLAAWCLTGGSHAAFSQSDQPAGRTPGAGPAFEVASAKVTPAEALSTIPVTKCENGRLTMRKASLAAIISWDFGVMPFHDVLPSWADGLGRPTYDIDAKAADPVPQERVKLMLQRLLVERFQFAAHHEM